MLFSVTMEAVKIMVLEKERMKFMEMTMFVDIGLVQISRLMT